MTTSLPHENQSRWWWCWWHKIASARICRKPPPKSIQPFDIHRKMRTERIIINVNAMTACIIWDPSCCSAYSGSLAGIVCLSGGGRTILMTVVGHSQPCHVFGKPTFSWSDKLWQKSADIYGLKSVLLCLCWNSVSNWRCSGWRIFFGFKENGSLKSKLLKV